VRGRPRLSVGRPGTRVLEGPRAGQLRQLHRRGSGRRVLQTLALRGDHPGAGEFARDRLRHEVGGDPSLRLDPRHLFRARRQGRRLRGRALRLRRQLQVRR